VHLMMIGEIGPGGMTFNGTFFMPYILKDEARSSKRRCHITDYTVSEKRRPDSSYSLLISSLFRLISYRLRSSDL
jgi:hypothetical protein